MSINLFSTVQFGSVHWTESTLPQNKFILETIFTQSNKREHFKRIDKFKENKQDMLLNQKFKT